MNIYFKVLLEIFKNIWKKVCRRISFEDRIGFSLLFIVIMLGSYFLSPYFFLGIFFLEIVVLSYFVCDESRSFKESKEITDNIGYFFSTVFLISSIATAAIFISLLFFPLSGT